VAKKKQEVVMSKKIDQININEKLNTALNAKVKELYTLLQDAAKGYKNIAFASSLGAEDMVLHDAIFQSQAKINIFSLDTGRLPNQTYELIDKVRNKYSQSIQIYFPDAQLIENYVVKNGINAFYNSLELRKECCKIRKVEPLKRALKGKDAWITGLRSAQSQTRDTLEIKAFDDTHQIDKINPLAEWSESEVWAYIKINDVPYNSLHDQFYPSIGCAPCTRAISPGEDIRAGRWWWENPENKECGLHIKD
jgi:phosphoadenosine phosphosulfate reductase